VNGLDNRYDLENVENGRLIRESEARFAKKKKFGNQIFPNCRVMSEFC
jgi:hypothetical protein